MVSVSVVQVSCGVVWVWGLSEHHVKVSSASVVISKESFFMRNFFYI